MILSYLYNLDELNKMGDGIVLNIKNYSFLMPKMYSLEEAKKIVDTVDKKVFISLTPLYHDSELDDVKNIIKTLKDADGFFFQDLGLYSIFKELNILSKAIYSPETFITNHLDKNYFKNALIENFLLSREITLDDIKKILSNSENTKYYFMSFGYQMLFYSYRNHLSNFIDKYNLDVYLKDRFDITIKEETRNEHYKVIEDSRGFRIYKDKIFNSYKVIDKLNDDINLIINREFINDELYFDAISLFKKEMNYQDFINKYGDELFTDGYLFHETGLLKEE